MLADSHRTAGFRDDAENPLAPRMIPQGRDREPARSFARVTVHGIDMWVAVVEPEGTYNRCRLELDHMSDEDVADQTVHMTSQREYEDHMELVAALQRTIEAHSTA
jgi:hypothetical protein